MDPILPTFSHEKEWCDVFLQFTESHGYLFDGIDWEYEGHDDLTAPTAKFTLETLDIMADFYASIASGNGDEKFSLDLDLPRS